MGLFFDLMDKEYTIAVIGLGYVGLPLTIAFSEFFLSIGYDTNSDRITSLNDSIDSNGDIQFVKNNNLLFTNDLDHISKANVYIITVPTPVKSDNTPDLNMIEVASEMISGMLNKDDIIIYESTVYPGVTEDICVPILEKGSGLVYNIDFYCGYSPERVSPGDNQCRLQLSLIHI